jgi:alkanesulfonate monooxygenase SsuD/methylene tetrahydromethanopterin reductase-like flavin-dependent oxidoreductase (luciferase family)
VGVNGIKWGVLLPTFGTGDEAPPLVDGARRGEELGFDGVWVGDHLLSPAPVLDAPCALSAAAAVTARVELGISVLQVGLRQPAWAAKQLATIDAPAPGIARDSAALLIQRQYRMQYRMPFERVEKWTAYGPAAAVAGMLSEYVDAGVTEFVFMPAGDALVQYERLVGVRDALP